MTKINALKKKRTIIMLVIILAIASVNIFMMYHSVSQSLKDAYPELKQFSNILYYSFFPFLVVLPGASFVVAMVLGFIPFRYFRYKEKLLTIFLCTLLILQVIVFLILLINGTEK